MFIKRNTRQVGKKTYVNHLLVESIATPKGPRHRVICSLGTLEPAPQEQWLALARRIQSSLSGQKEIEADGQLEGLFEKARRGKKQQRRQSPASSERSDLVAIHTDRIEITEPREAGTVHVAHQMWEKLGLDSILKEAGFSERARMLTQVMTINRLVEPRAEHAMPDWVRRTALADILGEDFTKLNDMALYRNLDRLHPERATIETALSRNEQELFDLDDTFWIYDLTSTYFEGQCLHNPQAKRGYSRDHRPDCKQVLVGLALSKEGFSKAHEVFEGNRNDSTTLDHMLSVLEERTGRKSGSTVVVDRGMAFDGNLKQIQARGHHYIVAGPQGERLEHLEEFEREEGWQEILREPSPRNPAQKKSRVWIKRHLVGQQLYVLCRGEGRTEKDRAIRDKHERRFLADLEKLQRRIAKGHLVAQEKVREAIGRLKQRYPRVARYYQIEYDPAIRALQYTSKAEKKEIAEKLDGTYLLKTDRLDLTEEEIWRIYILLTRIEAAFRSMKSPLRERPIFHHLEHRTQTHIFLCVLAYHLLVAIEKMFLDRGIHTSWDTLRQQLSTHQVLTIVLPAADGKTLRIRKASTPEQEHKLIYRTLQIPEKVIAPIKTWSQI